VLTTQSQVVWLASNNPKKEAVMSSRTHVLSLWLAAAALVVMLFGAGGALAAPAGTVVGLSGQCFVESGGTRAPLRLGQAVQVSDTVEVPVGGTLILRLRACSVGSVSEVSRMTVSADAVTPAGQRENAHLSLGQGLVRAVVAPVERPASFEVETAVGTAAVRSTDWFVEASGSGMQVGVLTGSVDMVSRATRRGVLIPARWGGRLEAGRDPVPPRVWSQAEFDAVIARTDVP
jgi:hypothetical protein